MLDQLSVFLVFKIAEKLDSIYTLMMLATTCKTIRCNIDQASFGLARPGSTISLECLMELLYSISLRRLIEPRMPRFKFQLVHPESAKRSFIYCWFRKTPVELLVRWEELIKWSRSVAPSRFKIISSIDPGDFRDIAVLVLRFKDSGDFFTHIVRIFSDPNAVETLCESDFPKTLSRSRQVNSLSEINELCLQHKTLSQLQHHLDRKIPLKIDLYELTDTASKPVTPFVTREPKLDRRNAEFRLHVRFANEPVSKELIFHWRTDKGVFRTHRKRSLRTTPYKREPKYSMRLTPPDMNVFSDANYEGYT